MEKPKQKKGIGKKIAKVKAPKLSTRQKYIIFGLITGLLVGAGIFMFISPYLYIFQKPPAPPEEYSKGWAIIIAYDPLNDQYVDCEVKLYYYYNESLYNTTSTNTTLYIPTASLALISAPGYYNVCISVKASEDFVYNQTVYIYKRANISEVYISIVKIDGVWGSYSPTDIPDGIHDVTFAIGLTGNSKNTSQYGGFCYIPSYEIDNTSFAYQYNLSYYGCWIVFNCTNITNARYTFDETGFQFTTYIYDVANGNKTLVFTTIFRSITITLTANFSSVSSIYFHTGLLDDYNCEKIII